MTWFQRLTGIDEESPEQVRDHLSVDGEDLVCPNANRIAFGRLEIPKLSELRQVVADIPVDPLPSTIREIVGDVRELHADRTNADALFQVASQFNLLEMVGPSVTPERGVGIYESDPTQGPACAIACGAGTIYRNYFAPVGDAIGQRAEAQIDCSEDLGMRLGNAGGRLWSMQNGYLFPNDEGLHEISSRLQQSNEEELDLLRGELRVGLQWQAEVTLTGANHKVSQAYCSALPVAYGRQATEQWTGFAQLVLDAAYEATLCAACVNACQTGMKKVYLTLLGGGVFGNQDHWILAAIERAFKRYSHHGLDVQIVSYGQSRSEVTQLVQRLGG
jgi:hypothetical protein